MIIASIDIGTNTVLLLIASLDENQILTPILNEYRIPRIGEGLLPGNEISQKKVNELINVLKEYQKIIKENNCDRIIVTGTNALRIAANTSVICSLIYEKFGWKVNVVSGDDEALLSYLGAINGFAKNKNYLVIDIGGGSTELIFGNGKTINYKKSFQIGVVSGSERFFKNDPPDNDEIKSFNLFLQNSFNELSNINYAPDFTIALAGTPTTLACMKLKLEYYDEDVIENCELSSSDIGLIIEQISKLPTSEIVKKFKSVVKGREDLILAGSIILFNIMKIVDINKVLVSTKGIRYGAIISEFNR